MRASINKNVWMESLIIYWGSVFYSDPILSTPDPSLKNSFLSDQSKNCVVCAQLHKKRVDNGLIYARINVLRSIKGRVTQ